MERIAIVIPSLDPNEDFTNLLSHIRKKAGSRVEIVVVNDDSSERFNSHFHAAEQIYQAHVLVHKENRGKGRALKTAFNYILQNLNGIDGAVTIDSDGQHTYKDMKKCIQAFYETRNTIIFGSREFRGNVPVRSKLGNTATRKVLESFTGLDLMDTQTGLRVIPLDCLEPLLDVEGERFEYEMNMIFFAKNMDVDIFEVPIQTIYLNENESSHFRPLSDSLKIYSLFVKHSMNSFKSFVSDLLTAA